MKAICVSLPPPIALELQSDIDLSGPVVTDAQLAEVREKVRMRELQAFTKGTAYEIEAILIRENGVPFFVVKPDDRDDLRTIRDHCVVEATNFKLTENVLQGWGVFDTVQTPYLYVVCPIASRPIFDYLVRDVRAK